MSTLPPQTKRLQRSFYQSPTIQVARSLIGKALLRKIDDIWVGGWIVETEAYLSERDPASHSARGQTPSNASMFQQPGTLYVYPIHAKHCLNAVTQPTGIGEAVLIRAIEPVWGIDFMAARRGFEDLRRLTTGPAKICQAIDVHRGDDGCCLVSNQMIGVYQSETQKLRRIVTTPRIGVTKATRRKLRFVDPESPFLSRRLARAC